jgi:hypothetical protein
VTGVSLRDIVASTLKRSAILDHVSNKTLLNIFSVADMDPDPFGPVFGSLHMCPDPDAGDKIAHLKKAL